MHNQLIVQVRTRDGSYRISLTGDVTVESFSTDSPPFAMEKGEPLTVDWMACSLESVNLTVGSSLDLMLNSTVLMVDAGGDGPLIPATVDLQGFGVLRPAGES